MGSERRQTKRFTQQAKAIIHSQDGQHSVEVEVINLSKTGVLLSMDRRCNKNLGQVVYIEIAGGVSTLVQGQLTTVQPAFKKKHLGFRFTKISRQACNKLDRMIKTRTDFETQSAMVELSN
jgi:hypothetical protein